MLRGEANDEYNHNKRKEKKKYHGHIISIAYKTVNSFSVGGSSGVDGFEVMEEVNK
jgi:hypothetical protein